MTPPAAPGSAARGWIEAAGFVVAIGALSVVYALGHALGAHPIAFILYAMIACATLTLALVGFGPHTLPIALHPASWAIGLAIILVEIFYFLTLTYVPPANGNLMLRIGIPLAMIAGWMLFDRRSSRLAIVGGLAIVGAAALLVAATPPDVRWPMALVGTLAGAGLVVRGFASELHPCNRRAHSVRDKLRFTGTVVLVTSLMSLALTAIAAGAIEAGTLSPTTLVPTGAQMVHVPTIVLGCGAGGAILALMSYLSFSSVVKIRTQNLMAMMAFSPVTTLAFQEAGVALGWIDASRPAAPVIVAMVVCIAGVLLIFYADVRARRRPA